MFNMEYFFMNIYQMIKIFTMVKDESDIIKDWLLYHGSIFGLDNIFIIDNYSNDGTYEILEKYQNIIHLSREEDYKLKGTYIKDLIDNNCLEDDIIIPIDADEFLVYYENNAISTNKKKIINYIKSLPEYDIYKIKYINTFIESNNKYGYKRATIQCNYGYYEKYSKSFFKKSLYSGNIDHCFNLKDDNNYLTNISFIHYKYRNLEQILNKIKNNIIGLGYKYDYEWLKKYIKENPRCLGYDNIINQINIFESTFKMYNANIINDIPLIVDLNIFINHINNLPN